MLLRLRVLLGLSLGIFFCGAGICSAQNPIQVSGHVASSKPVPCLAASLWSTPAEASCYRTTPDYASTMAYLRRVASATPRQVKIEPIGMTGEGRELDIVIASKDGVFDPAALHAARRPIVLVQNAIHAGEMDGKDACMALLRDMVITKSQAALLDRAVFVFIPMYNADGHERRSAYNRINQNGPEEVGWRGNGTNLNLNRDYLKADAPETRAFLAMFHKWMPDFFVDDHVTDGADYQYDVTFSLDATPNVASGTAEWINNTANPAIEKYVDAHGHLAAPTYINLVDDTNPALGLVFGDNPPRFSTGYMILEGRPGMLVELHMLKDYRTRVTGNYVLLVGLMELINRDADKLIDLNLAADKANESLAGKSVPLSIAWDGKAAQFDFKGYKFDRRLSEVSGTMMVEYSHQPWNVSLPIQSGAKIVDSVIAPAAYIIPAQWTDVIGVLAAHQVVMRRTTAAWTASVGTYHCSGMSWQQTPFEGRHPLFDGEALSGPGKFGECKPITATITYPANSAVIVLDQRLSQVAMNWLEPIAPDSGVRWGFFDPIFEQKEYGEFYVLEKLAREKMAADPALKAEFEKKVTSDPQFAASPYARLEFFYEHSPWFGANQVGLYPVGRLKSLDGVPLK